MASKLFSYVGSSTVNQWNKMERPGVLIENGHVTHVTFAVSDVDKNNQIHGYGRSNELRYHHYNEQRRGSVQCWWLRLPCW